MIVGLSIAILLSALLWLIIRVIVIRPLSRLREAAVIVKQGGELPKLQFKASPEIAEVSEAFNDMVSNLDERYHELEQALTTLQVTQDQLVHSEKMGALGNLVAGVSHEINTPIGIGVTAISYLDQKTKEFQALYETGKMKKSDLEQFLSITHETNAMVQSNLERASTLVRSFKQISVDQSVEIKRTFLFKDYIGGIIASLKPALKKTHLRIDVYCDDQLNLYTYPGALSQIITNLVMNSLNHAYDADEEGSLSIRVVEQPEHILITYADDGKGMTTDVLDHIFDPFFTTSRGQGGTGLGMNIVYNLVTQTLHGTIQCSSKLGQGSLFAITIPERGGRSIMTREVESADLDELLFAIEEDEEIETQRTEQDPWIVLIVDDEKQIHQVTKMVLQDFEFAGRKLEFHSAYSAFEAKRLLIEQPQTALVLLDVVMEHEDAGLQIAKYIREELNNQAVRIILRTGQPGQAPERTVIMDYDINDYKEKTELTSQKFFTTVVTALRSFRDIKTIEKSRIGLEEIIKSSATLFELQSMKKFASGVLTQMTSIVNLHKNAIHCSFAVTKGVEDIYILAASGDYAENQDARARDVVPMEVLKRD